MLDERTRHEMYLGLEQELGTAVADALQHLPPVGWADVATKHDLAALEERIDLRFSLVAMRFDRIDDRFDRIDQRFDGLDDHVGLMLDARLHAQINRLLYFLIPTFFTAVATGVAVARFG